MGGSHGDTSAAEPSDTFTVSGRPLCTHVVQAQEGTVSLYWSKAGPGRAGLLTPAPQTWLCFDGFCFFSINIKSNYLDFFFFIEGEVIRILFLYSIEKKYILYCLTSQSAPQSEAA